MTPLFKISAVNNTSASVSLNYRQFYICCLTGVSSVFSRQSVPAADPPPHGAADRAAHHHQAARRGGAAARAQGRGARAPRSARAAPTGTAPAATARRARHPRLISALAA